MDLTLKVVLKPRAWFSTKGLRYIRWVDSFLLKMEEKASEDEFYKRINWETAQTVIQMLALKKGTIRTKKS